MVKRIFFGFLLLLLFLVIFAPKQELYYKLEHILKEDYKITIDGEKFKEKPFGFKIEDGDIYLEDLKIGSFKSIDLDIFYLYDKLEIDSIEVDKNLKDSVKQIEELSILSSINAIDKIVVKFSILKPYKIAVDINGSFGDIKGGLYFNPNRLFFRVVKPKNISAIRRFLDKDEKGLYYEKPLE
jgi:hypothetical protein